LLLLHHPRTDQVVAGALGWERHMRFAPDAPQDSLAPIADAMAAFLTDTAAYRVRKCPSCAVHFWDTSKKGTRRWCSMNLCGNRSKVAAYAQRKRTTGG
jgi:predicted RNA-binding Zn ribbon-like protein